MIKKNEIIARAMEVAAREHDGMNRKHTDIPYIVHPFEVAMILQENGMNEEIIAAGLLHDTLEDAKLTKQKIINEFGEKILYLVEGASEELEDRDYTLWEERKEHMIEYLEKAPLEVKFIACADKLSNVRSMYRHYQEIGEKLWDRFMNSDKKINGKDYSREYKIEKQKWYYEEVVKSLDQLQGLKMYQELGLTVDELFKINNFRSN